MLGLAAATAAGIVLGWFILPQPEWARRAAVSLGWIDDD